MQLRHDPVEHGNAFQGVILALQGHEHSVGRHKGVERQDAQRGRAVHENHVEPLRFEDGLQGLGHALQVVFRSRQLDVRAAQVNLTRNYRQPLKGGVLNLLQQAALAQQREVGARAGRLLQTNATGGIGLRIEVEEQHAPADSGDAGGQVDRGGRLTHAALLVGDGDDFGWHAGVLPEVGHGFKLANTFAGFYPGQAASYIHVHELDPFDP